MFSEVSVILSMGGSLYDITSCLAACPHFPSMGVCVWGRGWAVGRPPESEKRAVLQMCWGGGVSQHALGQTPLPWTDISQYALGQTSPPRRPLQRTVRILLECILVESSFTDICTYNNWMRSLSSVFNYLTYSFTHPHSITQWGAHIATVIALLSLFIAPVITLS